MEISTQLLSIFGWAKMGRIPPPAVLLALLLAGQSAYADDEDAVTKAMDSTATQWSFQFAYQSMPNYNNDTLSDGSTRPDGLDNYVQARIVAPLEFDSWTMLPRITLRHYENVKTGKSGLGNTEIFGLIIPKSWDWGTGRMGLGPLITLPGNEDVAKDEWGYGFAGALVNSSGKWFYGVLLTQSWQAVDPNLQPIPGNDSDTNALGIAPFLNYQMGKGWYVGNGDMTVQYDWDSKEWYVPIGVRLGKVLPASNKKGSWNLYAEYQTSLVYDNWPGTAVETSIRVNVTRTLPAGF
jgi:hypothetical protein